MPPTPNPSAYYRLTNHFTGHSAPLSIYRDSDTGHVYLTSRTPSNTTSDDTKAFPASTPADEDITTPYWQILPVHGSSPPRFQILTEHRENGYFVFLALGVLSHDRAKPYLTKPGCYRRQYWSLTAWRRDGEEGAEGEGDGMDDVMLTNDYSGEELHLDTYFDTKQGFMGEGDHTGQHWCLERVEKAACCGSANKIAGKAPTSSSQLSLVEQVGPVGNGVFKAGLFAFGLGFGAAVVVAIAWVELLPLLLVGGLSLGTGLGAGIWLGVTSRPQGLSRGGEERGGGRKRC